MNSRKAKSSGATRDSQSVVLGTAGHIDHGKTSLVFALTGTATDRLPEEKSRGITIDLGFAALKLEDESGRVWDVSVIDVPGHHAFIRNMLAGAGGIDCVMLVIAADDGVRAQTREHLAICELLGICTGLVALTKTDAVTPERVSEVRSEIKQFLEGTFLHGAPIVAVSAVTKAGLTELRAELARVVASVPERHGNRIARLPVDRVFTVKGFGTVVTGTLQADAVRVDEALMLQPRGKLVRVRGVQVHSTACQEVRAPNRVALNLAGVDVVEVHRGDTLVPANTIAPSSVIDVAIRMLPDAPRLRHRSRVRVHAFASEAVATVLTYGAGEGTPDTESLVRLKLTEPMVLVPQDRFVVRQLSPAVTIAGGRVLDAFPLPRQRKTKAEEWLRRIASAPAEEQVLLRVQRREVQGLEAAQLVRETALTAEALEAVLSRFIASGDLLSVGDGRAEKRQLLGKRALENTCEQIVLRLTSVGKGAVDRSELLSKLHLPDWVVELAVRRLAQQKRVALDGARVSLPGDARDEEDAQKLAQVEAMYASGGLASPIASEVASKLGLNTKELHTLITQLIRAKKLVRMGADNLLVHSSSLDQLAVDLRKHRGESFDVARFKALTGLSRKHAIPLLEYLDGTRVTRNNNGIRIVL